MRQSIEICPTCNRHLVITRLKCTNCNITIDGHFEFSNLAKLNHAEQEFVELFIKNRGNIKRLEKTLGLSYPTICKQLDAIIKKIIVTAKIPR